MPPSLIDDAPEGVNVPEFSVSEISQAVKRLIEGEFAQVRVRGEIGRVSRPRSGHVYLDLKDANAVLAAVIWKGTAGRLDIEPGEGDEVVAEGRLTSFPGQSKYQLVIERLSYAGEGALLARLERLKKALAAEGLFDEARKRPLPYLPRVIGVVTSPSGAVIRDILHRLAERFPVHVLVWPVAVQGAACAPEVAAAIRGFSALAPDGPIPRPDVLIVARGGGSFEDLWGFNDEAVVRAAAESAIPLISAVGHETDTTLIDLAADRRAPTPTAAAEIAVPVRAELVATVGDLAARGLHALGRLLEGRLERLGYVGRALPRPEQLIAERRQRLDIQVARLPSKKELLQGHAIRLERASHQLPGGLKERIRFERQRFATKSSGFGAWLLKGRIKLEASRLDSGLQRFLPLARRFSDSKREKLKGLARLLASLHYEQALRRGFAIVRDGGGAVLTRAAQVAPGTALELEFADGRARATAEGKPPPARKPRRGGRGGGAQGSLF
ncbi:MAG TPA: exodeoxyribonuclease VII large subunit [Thermohalobaculum sp.]|nr:exodeoxyribonuclease VII large subunit [Thermohalobaculum sp.]